MLTTLILNLVVTLFCVHIFYHVLMPDNSSSLLSFLPFQDLDTNDFLKLQAPGFISLLIGFQKKLDLYQDIIESPERGDPLKCLQQAYIESTNCTTKKSGGLFYDAAKQNGLSVFHCNTRSPGKINPYYMTFYKH